MMRGRDANAKLMCLKTEEEAMGLGLQASLESGSVKGRDSSLELLEEHSPPCKYLGP